MQLNDLINGAWEFGGGAFSCINIYKLIKDKKINGVSWIPTAYVTFWGAWNLYYYPSLNQTFSLIGGIFIFITNIVWVALVYYYSKIYKNGRK